MTLVNPNGKDISVNSVSNANNACIFAPTNILVVFTGSEWDLGYDMTIVALF